tara:strand:- start:311 stop:1276 length:966 start_codon:yes stop_codon:yes gene_type:complete
MSALLKMESRLPQISVEPEAMAIDLPNGPKRMPLKVLPEKLVDWMDDGRRGMYERLRGNQNSNGMFFSQHLPVLVTHNPDSAFPFNCGNKGVGFLPKAEYLEEYTELYLKTMEQTRGLPWAKSLEKRLETVSEFNFNHDVIDYRCLTSLEIFEKRTFSNLCSMPLASLHYTGTCPSYVSFQLNCGVEILGQEDPRHTFVMLSRTMFEYDSFHITQPQFPYAYLFWISEVHDKTPHRVEEQPDKVQYLSQTGDMQWDSEAIESVNRAPGMIRQHIREQVEKYARERGFQIITLDLLQEAKSNLNECPVSQAANKTSNQSTSD